MKTTLKELIDTCASRYAQGCVGCPFYNYKCYEPTYPHAPREAKKHRKFKSEKILNKEVELKN
jgi:hypothetical protein|nr:MAG TPA: hypothetical protein [Caudoviricetes sp.]